MNNQVSKGSGEPHNTHHSETEKTVINMSNLVNVSIENMDIDYLFDCIRHIDERYSTMTDAEKDLSMKFISECEGSVSVLCKVVKDFVKKCEAFKNAQYE